MSALLAAKKATVASLANDIKPLAEKSRSEELTADESTRFDDLIGQLNAAKDDLLAVEARIASADAALATQQQFAQPAKAQPRELITDEAQPQAKSIGQQFVTSQEYQDALNTRSGLMKGSPFKTEDYLDGEKALIYSGTAPASLLLPQVMPGIYRGAEKMSAIRAVLGSGRTTSDVVTFMRELVFTNAAVEVAEATAVNEGAKPEAAITFEEDSATVRNIAHWIPITRQMLEDIPMMESYVDGRLRDGLERRVANQLVNGNGTAPNISGLLDQSGLTVADNTYFTANPVNDAGTDNENPNRIRRAKRLVRTTGLAQPTFILCNPADTEDWETLTDTQGQYLFGGPAVNGQVGRMWGLPVYEDEYVAAGTAIVGDGSMAAVIDRNDAAVYTTDSHSDYFIRNIFVLLAEVRLTLAVFRPAAFCVVTLV